MLDAYHGRPAERGAADYNEYVLGSIGSHNIVIACLPLGWPGAASAATVAMNLQHTFRHVRIGLLVGIGSGAPSAVDDIRLGDVVVSTPALEAGGVVQYERAPDRESRGLSGFLPMRYLNKPPPTLLSALSILRAVHTLEGSRVCGILAEAVARYPTMRARLTAPDGANANRLYQADYEHAGYPGSECDNCDDSMLVRRPERLSCDSVIHYGTIASGDVDFICGVTRDQSKAELKAILFEREAAGLEDYFPCLVIRGVSDYADSHKNGRWQCYAAATAAAFAKELLECTPPREI
jgi:nucleoside phosphorylase